MENCRRAETSVENLILQSARSFTDARARASVITPLIDSFHRL